MKAGQEKNVCPSLAEFRGYYNISEPYDNGFPVLRSVDQTPEFGFPELWEVCKAAEKWFAKAFPPLSDKPIDPIAEDEFVPRCEADDRTLCIEHVDFPRLKSELLRRLQKEFLGRYRLWRVLLCADAHSACIVIYPTVIRFGNEPADVDPDEALRRLVPHAMALRTERQRPHRAEVIFLQQRLPDAVRAIGDRLFSVIGLLDNVLWNEPLLTLCILLRGYEDDVVDVTGPLEAGNDFITTGKQLLWRERARRHHQQA